jgi:hypothetical protein
MRKRQRKSVTTAMVILYVIKNHAIYINFSFDFLGLDNFCF